MNEGESFRRRIVLHTFLKNNKTDLCTVRWTKYFARKQANSQHSPPYAFLRCICLTLTVRKYFM